MDPYAGGPFFVSLFSIQTNSQMDYCYPILYRVSCQVFSIIITNINGCKI